MDASSPPLPPLPAFRPGWVWLAGAGPGEPGLLTLLAFHALKAADAVVYDALVDESVLALARPEAELVFAGKRGGRPSPSQGDISGQLVALAGAGRRVLRLKGGDPFVFGRGGEEALALAAAGVPFRVVPGITAGIGGLAYAGIPATHRGAGHAIALVTAHMAGGSLPQEGDWQALAAMAAAGMTLAIYMPLRHLDAIAARLMAAGLDGATPAAAIAGAATRHQRVVETRLDRAAHQVAAAGLAAPVILAVGRIVALRSRLDWLPAAIAGERDSAP